MGKEVTVLYLAGSSRTGSTIVANVLGQLDGYFAVGELWNIWRRGIIESRKCGCGEPVGLCPQWDSILQEAFGRRLDLRDAQRLDVLTRQRLQNRSLRAIIAARSRSPDADEYRSVLAALYRAVHDVTGCRVIVDSSKSPLYASLLATLPGVRLHVVHLLRDPRAAAFSATRVRELPDFGDGRSMRQERPHVTARRWTVNHVLCSALLPEAAASFTRLRYEDFMANPAQALGRVVTATGIWAPLPFTAERTVTLAETHSVSGNPGRFRLGEVTLRLDDEWRHEMRPKDRAVVTALTWPLLVQHRYPLWAGRSGRASTPARVGEDAR